MHDIYVMVNSMQSAKERVTKYHLARAYGADSATANRLRDWHWSKLYGQLDIIAVQAGLDNSDLKSLCEQGWRCFEGSKQID